MQENGGIPDLPTIVSCFDCVFIMHNLSWLAHKDSRDSKHLGWRHPLAVLLVHYGTVFATTFAVHDWLLDPNKHATARTASDGIPWLVLIYSLWLLVWRLIFCKPKVFRSSVLYEYCWLCNVTLSLGAASLALQRPAIAAACCVTVGIDQLLWYVDLAGYLISGKFPIGVTAYLFWENTSWSTRITCTHHFWTIPLFVYATRCIPAVALPLSAVIMVINVISSRYMIPAAIEAVDPTTCGDRTKPKMLQKYLNVNLSHALWKDIKISWLQINHDDPPALIYLWRLLWRWEGFNILIFGILRLICHFAFERIQVE